MDRVSEVSSFVKDRALHISFTHSFLFSCFVCFLYFLPIHFDAWTFSVTLELNNVENVSSSHSLIMLKDRTRVHMEILLYMDLDGL